MKKRLMLLTSLVTLSIILVSLMTSVNVVGQGLDEPFFLAGVPETGGLREQAGEKVSEQLVDAEEKELGRGVTAETGFTKIERWFVKIIVDEESLERLKKESGNENLKYEETVGTEATCFMESNSAGCIAGPINIFPEGACEMEVMFRFRLIEVKEGNWLTRMWKNPSKVVAVLDQCREINWDDEGKRKEGSCGDLYLDKCRGIGGTDSELATVEEREGRLKPVIFKTLKRPTYVEEGTAFFKFEGQEFKRGEPIEDPLIINAGWAAKQVLEYPADAEPKDIPHFAEIKEIYRPVSSPQEIEEVDEHPKEKRWGGLIGLVGVPIKVSYKISKTALKVPYKITGGVFTVVFGDTPKRIAEGAKKVGDNIGREASKVTKGVRDGAVDMYEGAADVLFPNRERKARGGGVSPVDIEEGYVGVNTELTLDQKQCLKDVRGEGGVYSKYTDSYYVDMSKFDRGQFLMTLEAMTARDAFKGTNFEDCVELFNTRNLLFGEDDGSGEDVEMDTEEAYRRVVKDYCKDFTDEKLRLECYTRKNTKPRFNLINAFDKKDKEKVGVAVGNVPSDSVLKKPDSLVPQPVIKPVELKSVDPAAEEEREFRKTASKTYEPERIDPTSPYAPIGVEERLTGPETYTIGEEGLVPASQGLGIIDTSGPVNAVIGKEDLGLSGGDGDGKDGSTGTGIGMQPQVTKQPSDTNPDADDVTVGIDDDGNLEIDVPEGTDGEVEITIPDPDGGDDTIVYFDTDPEIGGPPQTQELAPRSAAEKSSIGILVLLLAVLGTLSWMYFKPQHK